MERLITTDFSQVPDVPFSYEARAVYQLARAKAGLPESGRLGTAHVGTEHLLLFLAHDPSIRSILTTTGIEPDAIITELDHYISEEDDNLPPINDEGLTPTVEMTIRNAQRLAERDGMEMTTTHLYAGMIEAEYGKALIVLGTAIGIPPSRETAAEIRTALFRHIPRMQAA